MTKKRVTQAQQAAAKQRAKTTSTLLDEVDRHRSSRVSRSSGRWWSRENDLDDSVPSRRDSKSGSRRNSRRMSFFPARRESRDEGGSNADSGSSAKGWAGLSKMCKSGRFSQGGVGGGGSTDGGAGDDASAIRSSRRSIASTAGDDDSALPTRRKSSIRRGSSLNDSSRREEEDLTKHFGDTALAATKTTAEQQKQLDVLARLNMALSADTPLSDIRASQARGTDFSASAARRTVSIDDPAKSSDVADDPALSSDRLGEGGSSSADAPTASGSSFSAQGEGSSDLSFRSDEHMPIQTSPVQPPSASSGSATPSEAAARRKQHPVLGELDALASRDAGAAVGTEERLADTIRRLSMPTLVAGAPAPAEAPLHDTIRRLSKVEFQLSPSPAPTEQPPRSDGGRRLSLSKDDTSYVV